MTGGIGIELFCFERRHREEAAALALAGYREERRLVKELPQECELPDLTGFAENGLGVAAFEGKKMVGFLCACDPFDNAFRATDARGVFSPMGANAAVSENRAGIYAAMYQAAGAKWVQAGAVSHAVCLYAHEEEVQRQFYRYGFGLRCIDAVRPMELIECKPCTGYAFAQLPNTECRLVYPLYLALHSHYRESPFFMDREPETPEEFLASSMREDVRYFVAERNGKLCAYLKIAASGETFAARGNDYRHIRGAYCLPEHRGRGVYQNLLNFAIAALKKEGYARLGVNFESFNPTGRGFWLKYFAAYTHSVVRRIDERIVQRRG